MEYFDCNNCQRRISIYDSKKYCEECVNETMNGLMMKYFVLNPTKKDAYGEASRKAMLAYARAIKLENPELAKDLQAWVKSLEATTGESIPKK